MTRASYPCGGLVPQTAGNSRKSQRSLLVARLLLAIAPVALPMLSAGCVVPLAYENAGDAGTNHVPVIVASLPTMPGPVMIATEGQEYSVDVEDRDEGDQTWLRVFRLGDVTPSLVAILQTQHPGGAARRQLILNTQLWCTGVTAGSTRYFEVVVADRKFADNLGMPPYREAPGGDTSSRIWVATCL